MLALVFLLAAAEPTVHTGCETAPQESEALRQEKAELDRAFADIAMGRSAKRKKKDGGAAAARAVAGTAASILLPFPLGVAVNAGATAAAKSGKKSRPAPRPDVQAMLARSGDVDARLRILATCPRE
ncbi:MAG TPA: hypothetical protein VHM92_02445 [Allosphingosinicella sp.]|nr:hypothetical protein [Allosphingosinicella sp.]